MACLVVRGNVSIVLPRWQAQRVGGEYFSSLLGVELAHLVDLDRVFGRHGLGHNTGVRAAVALVLGQNFRKSKKTSTSNWALHQLSPGQIRYAANDAHAPAVLHRALPAWEAAQAAAAAARPPRATRPHISRIST